MVFWRRNDHGHESTTLHAGRAEAAHAAHGFGMVVPNWSTLRGENAYYVSLYPDSVLAHWARDVTRWHDEDLPTLLYRARREYRSLQETLGSIGTL
jgi:hypothetical protein